MSRFPRWWFWAAVMVPAVITLVGLVVQGGSIERDVEASVRAALAADGQPLASVAVDGRDVTIGRIPAEQLSHAQRVAGSAPGSGSVSTVEPALAPMRMTFRGNEIVVVGTTEHEGWRKRFVQAISEQAHGRTVVDQTKTAPGMDFPITTPAAAAAVSVITQQPSDMTVSVDSGRVTVAGVVPDANRRTAIVAVLRRLFGATTVVDQTKGSP